MAAWNGHDVVVARLLAAGAAVQQPKHGGATPLTVVAKGRPHWDTAVVQCH